MIVVVSEEFHELLVFGVRLLRRYVVVPAATVHSSLSIISNTNKSHFIWEVLGLTCSASGEHEESTGDINKEISPGLVC